MGLSARHAPRRSPPRRRRWRRRGAARGRSLRRSPNSSRSTRVTPAISSARRATSRPSAATRRCCCRTGSITGRSAACRRKSAASSARRGRRRWARRRGFPGSPRRRWSPCCGMSSAGPRPRDAAAFADATGVSRETMARLEAYAALLVRWSARINLVGRATLGDLWWRHFLDSAQLLPLLSDCRSVIDLGSGAGFPGLVLAVMGVRGVELIEAVAPGARDAVTARGCAPLDRLLALAERFIGPQTRCLLLKGEQAEDELAAAAARWRMQVTRYPSRADPRGVVLRLERVARA